MRDSTVRTKAEAAMADTADRAHFRRDTPGLHRGLLMNHLALDRLDPRLLGGTIPPLPLGAGPIRSESTGAALPR